MAEDEAKRQEMQTKFLRMAQNFGWNLNHAKNNNMKHENDEDTNKIKPISHQSNNNNNNSSKRKTNDLQNTEICPTCGSSISLFFIDNHKKHCRISMEPNNSPSPSPPQASPLSERHSSQALFPYSEANQLIPCKYCEFECDEESITEHEYYCACRTDLCERCGIRDTIKSLKENTHQCSPRRNQIQNQIVDLCSSDSEHLYETMDNEATSNHNNSNNHNHNHSYSNTPQKQQNNPNNHSFYQQLIRSHTPQLIREERQRIAEIERLDREFAMDLQREMQEHKQLQEHKQSDHELAMHLQHQIDAQPPASAPQAREQNYLHAVLRQQNYFSSLEHEAHMDFIMRGNGVNGPRNQMNNYSSEFRDLNVSNISNMDYDELNELFPVEPEGANRETIERLPTSIFKSCNNSDGDINKCCVCLEAFKNGDEIRRLQCLHIFHKNEIDEWLSRNKVCPICRIDIEEHV